MRHIPTTTAFFLALPCAAPSAFAQGEPAVHVERRPGIELRTDAHGHTALALDARAVAEPTGSDVAALLDASWSPIGPFGGDVEDVAGSPVDPNVVLAGLAPSGGVGGSLYRSTDGGASWTQVAGLVGTSVHDIEFAPDGTAYLGTVDGVRRSIDGGATWTDLPLGIGLNDQVFEVTLDPSDPSRIWVGVADALGSQTQNVLLSTNGGASWINRTPPGAAGSTCRAIAVHPTNSNEVVVAFGSGFGGGTVWVTTNGGTSWVNRTSNLPANPMRDLVHQGSRVLVCGGQLFGSQFVGLYQTTNLGVSWTALHDGSWPTLAINDIEVDPNAPNRIWVASAGQGAFASTNGGASWSFGVGGTGSLTLNEVAVRAHSSLEVLVGASSNAVFRSTNGGASFAPSSVGIGQLSVYAVASNPIDPAELAIAFQGANDGGVYTSTDGGQAWSLEPLPGTRYMDVAFAPDGTLYAISDGPTTVAPEGVYRRNPGGSWSSLGPDQGVQFESRLYALQFSESDPQLLFAVGSDFGLAGFEPTIWRSPDGGGTWFKAFEGLGTSDDVKDVEPLRDGTDLVWLACHTDTSSSQDGGVLRSVDGGFNWSPANSGLPSNVQGESLSASRLDPTTFYLGDNAGGGVGRLRVSTDGGQSWSVVSAVDRVLRVQMHPHSDQVLYTAHTSGVRARRSFDAGTSLGAFDTGLAASGFVRDLALTAGGLRALLATSTGTWARGLETAVPYCPRTPNSVGPGAAIGYSGSTSVAANDLVLTCTGLPPFQNGIYFYGGGQVEIPFGNGLRCVGPGGVGVFRLPVVNSGAGGVASFALNLGALPAGGAIPPGSIRSFQFWYRDPIEPPSGFDLSDALRAVFVP